MTSWDGENMFRGSSSEGLSLYPFVTLDSMFTDKNFKLANGQEVNLTELPKKRSAFKNEWEWNDYYKAKSIQWIRSNPSLFFKFTKLKMYNFFIMIIMGY